MADLHLKKSATENDLNDWLAETIETYKNRFFGNEFPVDFTTDDAGTGGIEAVRISQFLTRILKPD